MTFHSLDAWLQALEQRHPSAIDLGLERVGIVADRLAARHFKAPVITVAGTNGKGSTVAALVAIAVASGWRVASYTSPHLIRFNERICLDGQPIADADLVTALDAVEAVRGDVSLTYFEHTTLAAFWWFQRQQPDLVVLEVGLGGRLDAVNLVDASVAVITSVDLDHQDWLGDTRAQIAREKAGILRAGRPVVLGERDPQPVLLEMAAALSCPTLIKGRDYEFSVPSARHSETLWQWRTLTTAPAQELTDLPLPALACENAATALAALQALSAVSRLRADITAIRSGLSSAVVSGRAQRIATAPEVWLDVGHNPHGVQFLWEQLPPARPGQQTHAVFAMLRDKDIDGVIAASRAHVQHWWPAGLDVPRGCTLDELMLKLRAQGLEPVAAHQHVTAALAAARQQARAGDRIIAFGSFYTVAAILASGD